MLADMHLVISPHVFSQRLGEETVLLNADSGAYFGLTPVASRAWELMQEGVGTREILAKLEAEFDAPSAQIEQDLEVFLLKLREKELVAF
ncbi:PqqD family protein [Acidipila sp. EB88]|uniref:PqqD family protein n=1 Tax=Acidipila sp. EB88 TaxID=2305226 RepID=UPI000F5F7B05|nr:PqqD family protein [Acidipila sp. EB88]RRA47445.1 PqqD family protein [Acidipila sp. EB88]